MKPEKDEMTLLSSVVEKIKFYIESINDKSLPVHQYCTPDELSKKINLTIDKKGVTEKEFLSLLETYITHSVKTGHKLFFNQLYAGYNHSAFIGEIITALTNTSMSTYEVAPVATLIEQEMIRFFNTYTGYTDGDGIFLTGGSNANLIAMFSARNRILPESANKGYNNIHQLLAFTNEQSHYSINIAANLLGIGTNQVISIPSDNNGKMIPRELEKSIKQALSEKKKPFFVAATCASTVMGSFDSLEEISVICEKYKIWFHADGAFGGSLLFSNQHKLLMKGIEKTDSFAWDPHKLMNIPLVCSVLLVKQKGILNDNITDIDTDYIYHRNEEMNDIGEKSIQCGRRVDAVKVWIALKYTGIDNYEKRIDNLMELAQYAEQKIIEEKQLELIVPRQSLTLCFRYKPNAEYDNDEINDFNFTLREALRKSGKTLVNYAHIKGTLAIRFVLINGMLERSDIDMFFEILLTEGKRLENDCKDK